MGNLMKRTNILLCLTIASVIAFVAESTALSERQLAWNDLIPDTAKFNDPFESLDRESLEYLGFVARIRNMTNSGEQVSQGTLKELSETEQLLASKGIDTDNLLNKRKEVIQLRKKSASQVVVELNGASVKMPGYLLPLEYSGLAITEFLLVPWVGACIHTPPPPPNQIVHVKLAKNNPYRSVSMFEPVWVYGTILTQRSTKNVFLTDGSGDINMGYKMMASKVAKYK